jgi:hypothetical protein
MDQRMKYYFLPFLIAVTQPWSKQRTAQQLDIVSINTCLTLIHDKDSFENIMQSGSVNM